MALSATTKSNYVHYINLFYLGFITVSEALRYFLFPIDGAQRGTFIVLVVVFFANLGNKGFWKKAGGLATIGWICWTVYATIMKLRFGLNPTDTPMSIWIWNKLLMPCSVLVIATYECMCNPKRLIRVIIYCLCFNLLIYTIFGKSKFDVEGGLGNEQPLKAFVFLAFLCVASYYKIINKKSFFAATALALGITFWIATRKALAAEAIILVAYFYSNRKINLKTALLTVLVLIFADLAYDFILNNTFIGERIEEQAEADYSKWNPNNNWFLNLVQDRAFFYVVGWDYFLKYPIFGIGIGNFTYYTGIPELPIHSEYMVQICECGIVGCVFYLTFMLSMLRGLLKTPFLKGAYLIIGASFLAMLWLSFTAWVYDGCYYMMLYALIISIPRLYLRDKKTGMVKLM